MDKKIKKYIGPFVQVLGGVVFGIVAAVRWEDVLQALLFLTAGLVLIIIGVFSGIKK